MSKYHLQAGLVKTLCLRRHFLSEWRRSHQCFFFSVSFKQPQTVGPRRQVNKPIAPHLCGGRGKTPPAYECLGGWWDVCKYWRKKVKSFCCCYTAAFPRQRDTERQTGGPLFHGTGLLDMEIQICRQRHRDRRRERARDTGRERASNGQK